MRRYERDRSGSGQEQVAGTRECGNEPWSSNLLNGFRLHFVMGEM